MAIVEDYFKTEQMRSFQDRIQKIIELQEKAQSISDISLRRKEEGNYRRMLDDLYWEVFEHLCLQRLFSKQSRFESSESLIINFGLLSHQQLTHAHELGSIQVENTLLKLQGVSPYDDSPIYRLSEWASLWHMNAQIFNNNSQHLEPKETWIDDEKATKFLTTRFNIYKRLLPILKTLPGANFNFLKSLLNGDFDQKVEVAMALLQTKPEKVDLGHRRLISLFKTLIAQLQASIQDPEHKKMIVVLEKINHSFVQRRCHLEKHSLNSAVLPVITNKDEDSSGNESKTIQNEIKLIKNLLPIGGIEGKEFFTSPILRQTDNLISKTFVGDTLRLVHQCDPHIPRDLPIIIIPFRGSGFFEFDKNTLIIPLFPSLPPQEVIIRALGNYRLLTDQLEHQGEMKRRYEKQFDKGRFKERFLQDYVQWITHVSKGHRKIMNDRKFDFFVEFVGPNPKMLLSDQQISNMQKPQLRRKINDLLASPSINQENYLTLAICFWLLEDPLKSLRYAECALTAGMPNPKVFLSYGYTLKEMKDRTKATQMFKNCMRYYKNTLWGAYASRELERK